MTDREGLLVVVDEFWWHWRDLGAEGEAKVGEAVAEAEVGRHDGGGTANGVIWI